MNKILFAPDSAPVLPPAAPLPAAGLTTAAATQKLADLKTAVASAQGIIDALLSDPHFKNCPFVAAVRSGLVNGAAERLKHVDAWLAANPVPAAK